jgi:hypothetical protein
VPLVLDGPMTGEVFRAYVEQMLALALAPGDVVVLVNLVAQGRRCGRGDRGHLSQPALSAAVLAGPEPDRDRTNVEPLNVRFH